MTSKAWKYVVRNKTGCDTNTVLLCLDASWDVFPKYDTVFSLHIALLWNIIHVNLLFEQL